MGSSQLRRPPLFGPAPSLFALRFPNNVSGSDTGAPYAVIKKANPQSDGLPIWGPGNAGVTVIRRVRTLQHTGYYAQIWWSPDDGSWHDSDATYPNWGAHPYPTNSSNSGTSHVWEVATEAGDFFNEAESGSTASGYSVTKDAWYTQAIRVTHNGGTKTVRLYPDLSNTSQYAQGTTSSGYGNSLAGVNFALTIGDSPWYAGFQHERFGGDLAWIKIIAKSMSEADIVSEAANKNALVTSDAQGSNWWSKKGFASVDDLTDDFGTGRSLTRVDSSNVITTVSQG